MAKNRNLNTAAKAKKDKFYTQLEDIENEVHHYKDFFKGKIVLCNCDDPIESQFFVHFACLFNHYELKKLIATSYADSPIAGKEINLFPDGKTAYKVEMTEFRDWNGDSAENWDDIELGLREGMIKTAQLEGDEKYCAGDFRSKECIELLKEADVVVTNPPFSVFREFVKLLIDFDKKFLIVGPVNAITYKEIFPLIKENKMWLGYGFAQGNAYFSLPKGAYKDFADGVFDEETGLVKFRNVHWYTNIETPKRFWDIPLWAKYSPEKNPYYDNYDAIEVSKTAEIPEDYFGVMGVPITFLEQYNPNQFEILGCPHAKVLPENWRGMSEKFIKLYYEQGNTGSYRVGHRLLSYIDANGKAKVPYARILIRRRRGNDD